MYLEGKCTLKDLRDIVEQAFLSAGWKNISSNKERDNSSDGYVFQSSGEAGDKDIIVGFRNAYYANNWQLGLHFFAASNYTPNEVAGVNGVFEDKFYAALVYSYYPEGLGYNEETLPLSYWININRDRIIIATRGDYSHSYNRTGVLFGGLPHVYDDKDKNCVSLFSTYNLAYNSGGSGITIGTAPGSEGAVETISTRHILSHKRNIWGDALLPSHIQLYQQYSLRGWLDILVCASDSYPREVDEVKIGEKYYLALKVPTNDRIIYDNDNDNNNDTYFYNNFCSDYECLLLIPKF